MRASQAMTRDVQIASPDQSIREVATIMAQSDAVCGLSAPRRR